MLTDRQTAPVDRAAYLVLANATADESIAIVQTVQQNVN